MRGTLEAAGGGSFPCASEAMAAAPSEPTPFPAPSPSSSKLKRPRSSSFQPSSAPSSPAPGGTSGIIAVAAGVVAFIL